MHRKSILIHAAVWAGWFLLNLSWVIVMRIPQPAIPLIYNISSLIVVFYATRWIASRYWNSIENDTNMWVDGDGNIVVKRPSAWSHYLFRWPVAGVVGVVLAYIVVSWYAEVLFDQLGLFQKNKDVSFYQFTFIRWSVESIYVCGGNVMAAIEYHMRQENKKRQVLEESTRQQHLEKTVISEQVKGLIDKLNRKNAEIANRLKDK